MTRHNQSGFTLMEVIVSVSITLLIMVVLFTGLNQAQRRYRGEQLLSEVSDGVRGASELIAQEIAVAGYHGFQTRTVALPVVGSLAAQQVSLGDAGGIFVGQRLLVDVGEFQEDVEVTAVSGNAVTGVFRRIHSTGAVVNTTGPFPTGVLPTSTATILSMFGDFRDDGTLVYVEYRIRGNRLTRTETPVGAGVQNPWDVILDDVIPNPGGTPVFQYGTEVYLGDTYVTQVTVTLTSETSTPDPETGELRNQTVAFSVSPRNVMAAHQLDSLSLGHDFLQNQPPGLPIPPGVQAF
jgi:prepilin-type N-terminal cleavage/methylation domain-containing protein